MDSKLTLTLKLTPAQDTPAYARQRAEMVARLRKQAFVTNACWRQWAQCPATCSCQNRCATTLRRSRAPDCRWANDLATLHRGARN
jgi:hypothetical protein